jgi:septum formation inhibitor-activating ATPase MinD
LAAEWRSYTFCPLFPSPGDGQALELLEAGLNPQSSPPVHLLTAPVQGLAFFDAEGEAARQLDRWWARSVPPDSLPVILLLDAAGLEGRLAGLDADFVVGVATHEDLERYAGLGQANVHVVVTEDCRELTEFAMQSYAVGGLSCFRLDFPYSRWWLGELPPAAARPVSPALPAPAPVPPGYAEWVRTVHEGEAVAEAARGEARPQPDVRPAPQPSLQGGGSSSRPREPIEMTSELPDPFDLLSRLPPMPDSGARGTSTAGPGVSGAGAPPRSGRWQRLVGRRGAGRLPVSEELTALLVGLAPGAVITVASRKGGVGKTALAAGVAQVAGYALERTGSAAVIDQNISNPDQWGRMDVPPGCQTVWDLMMAIEAGQELPPAPTWAAFSPALAVYPESRQAGEGYSWGTIESFVRQLRGRHLLSVVDLPNRLPDAGSAEASISAAYTRLADLVVLPTDDDRNSMQGVLDYLSTESMRDKRVVVAYRVSPDREVSRDPLVLEMLGEIEHRVEAVERVPKTEKATLAVNRGRSILDVHSGLRDAYVRMTLTIARQLAL